ncbi:hypothetical protein CAEBREN_16948 [Caenorhabditis brenneri]|uniref:Uncharacterized protein n=1 Tax=Caenorhabditis brenneri TaxID=135651 RepID=G0MWP7_CAEBE|nr:hypothetical protein CAEBREN_16948 [Caenorhabditis brenneri]
MSISFYDIPLKNHWTTMTVEHDRKEKKFVVTTNKTDKVLMNENTNERKHTMIGHYAGEKYLRTMVYTELVKSGFHIVRVEDVDQTGKTIGECLHLAKRQADFVSGHITWETKFGNEKKRIVLDLETKEVFFEDEKVTVALAGGVTVFTVEGQKIRIEGKGDEWQLEVNNSRVDQFKPRNGPN